MRWPQASAIHRRQGGPLVKIFRNAGRWCKGRSAASGSRPNSARKTRRSFIGESPTAAIASASSVYPPDSSSASSYTTISNSPTTNTARKSTGSAPSNPHKHVFPRVAASVPGQSVKAAACPP